MKTLALLFLVFFVSLTAPLNASAYIDPGSGSMALQLLLAGVAGAGVALKLYWRRFLNLFKKSSNESKSS